MIVALECSFVIFEGQSLKAKRSIVRPMIDKIRARYNVSIAEIDHQDLWQRATFLLVAASASRQAAEKEIKRALRVLESSHEWELIESEMFYY